MKTYTSENGAQEGQDGVVFVRVLCSESEQGLYKNLLEFIINFIHIIRNTSKKTINSISYSIKTWTTWTLPLFSTKYSQQE